MKAILIVAFYLTSFYCNGQASGDRDSTIELRFQLIEEKSSGQLALDVQVINHLGKDIYIPYIIDGVFHLYEQSDEGWSELDPFTHQYYAKGDMHPLIHQPLTDIRDKDQDITWHYHDSTNKVFFNQRSIIKSFSAQNPDFKINLAQFVKPIFLKAGEKINYFRVIPMDYIKQNAKAYKICYAGEVRDISFIESSNKLAMELPEKMLSYTRYIPGRIMANTLYYSSIQ